MKTISVLVVCALLSAPVFGDLVSYWALNYPPYTGTSYGYLSNAFPLVADEGSGLLTVGGGIVGELTTISGFELYRWVQNFAGSTLNAQPGYDLTTGNGSISIQGGTGFANNGSYIQFAFSMAGYEDLAISYATRGTATGFTSQTWSWSTDGSTFTDFETITGTTATTYSTKTLTTQTALDGAATAYIRVTFNGATNVTGNNRLDNVTFAANAVPEPATMLLLGLGGMLACRRK